MTHPDQVLQFVADYAVQHHNSPSLGEIASELNISKMRVYLHMLKLIDNQQLEFVDRKWKIVGGEYIPPKHLRH